MQSRCSRIALLISLAWLAPTCASAPDDGSWTPPKAEDTVAPAGSPVALHGQLKVVGTQLRDANDQPVQLKGVSSMWLNYESFSTSKKALTYMRDNWKVSIIRAAMGSTPEPSASILKKVDTIIRNALALGVYVIVDWHTERAVDQQPQAIAFFTDLATKYGTYPNVIWEPYNEPHRSSPDYQWSEIKVYHQAVVDAIRAIDPDNLIVLGTPNWSQFVDVAAKDPVAGTNLLYTLHFYSCSHTGWLRARGDAAIAAGAALFITEFGATDADGGLPGSNHYYVCDEEANLWFDWMNKNNISGVAWKLDSCADASCILTSEASQNGPWPDSVLSTFAGGETVGPGIKGSHGLFVVNWLRQ
jgi:endoglucanase